MIPHAPWFTEARLGMFIHLCLYALRARHEWVMNQRPDVAVPVVETFPEARGVA